MRRTAHKTLSLLQHPHNEPVTAGYHQRQQNSVRVPSTSITQKEDAPKVTQNPRTSVMDAERDDDRSSRITIHRHSQYMSNLAEPVIGRIIAHVTQNPTGCVYFNPAVTISCSQPCPAFFQVVKKEQADWCRQASRTFKNPVRRRVSSWISPAVVNGERSRYHDRALCFTGILFINGKMIPHRNWPVVVTSQSG